MDRLDSTPVTRSFLPERKPMDGPVSVVGEKAPILRPPGLQPVANQGLAGYNSCFATLTDGRNQPPVFYGRSLFEGYRKPLALQDVVEQTVTGLGYDLVEVERSAGGLLRVTIDMPWGGKAAGEHKPVTVEDCEKVTRQLQYALEVDAVDYK